MRISAYPSTCQHKRLGDQDAGPRGLTPTADLNACQGRVVLDSVLRIPVVSPSEVVSGVQVDGGDPSPPRLDQGDT